MKKQIKAWFKKLWPYGLPLLAGASLVLAFSPYHIILLGFIAPAVLLFCLQNVSPKKGFIRGYFFGLGLFGFGASWIYVSIYTYGGESMVISGIITVLFVLTLALFPGILGWLLNKFSPKSNYIRSSVAFPVLWVLLEILRGWIFTGFPWLFIGYTQEASRLSMLAPLGSVWLVSWATVLNAGVLFEIVTHFTTVKPKHKKLFKLLTPTLAVWIAAFALNNHAWTTSTGTLEAALIQGNIAQEIRWDQAAVDKILFRYQTLTQEVSNADVVIWPEGAIPVALPYSEAFVKNMHAYASNHHFALITGVPIKAAGDREAYYNGIVAVGEGTGMYFKRHLVPFGEYVPFEKLLRGLIAFFDLPMSNFIEGPAQQPIIAKGVQVAPAVCYEIAYPFTMRNLSLNSQFIVTISNDAWFGASIGPWQHLQIAQMRALETGRYVLRATNTGITALIGPDGEIRASLPQFKDDILKAPFQTMTGLTPWMQFGPWSLWGFLGVLGLWGFWPRGKKIKNRK